ncbi:aldehyde dehydrogenase [Pseudonocardia sulfidoxydans NBRC 16205]|uniref:Aldehyde dehydrogenase n=1 Tax=Pseudonocardia sulfidoxydans NBRC 16205 TaxID=1223511 RepID=A0A511DJW0_9PSEU|nr:xanthine dehydrogenase family protein molybdopterin-binding subunit [Pseudonocardia sulfidoxydans]GEL25082.1 aldehyde dehydrogenase [Pseudonocardia sulfidoxydans NBRC 16205]
MTLESTATDPAATSAASSATTPQQPRPARYVGRPVQRVEDPRLLSGQGRYIDDVALPGMLHAAFVRSPHAHARIVGIDATEALAVEGVVAVYTGKDLDWLAPMVSAGPMREGVLAQSRSPLAVEVARHVGDPVAVVLARSPYLAEDGRDLVDVEWEPLTPVLDPFAALHPDSPLVDEALGTNNISHLEQSAGDVDTAFAEADHVTRIRFHSGRSTAAPIECRGVVAEYEDRAGGRFNVYSSTQMPHLLRMLIAPVLGVSQGQLSVKAPDVGGAFGLKCTVFPEDIVVPAVARMSGRPVKWIEDRWEDLAAGVHSKDMHCSMEIAATADGTMTAFRGHFVTDSGAYSSIPFTPLVDSQVAGVYLSSCYGVQNVAYSIDNPLTNKCQIGAVRGVGWVPGQLAREVAIDQLARSLGKDPVELRLQNMIGPEVYTTPFGQTYDGGSYAAALEKARDAVDYPAFRQRQAQARADGRYLGVGFSPFVEPTGWGTASAAAGGLPNGFFDTASVTVEPDGSVTVTTGLHSHGQGHETTLAQVTADELGVAMDSVRIVFGDTDSSVFGMGTYASRSAVLGFGSIQESAVQVRDRLVRLAAAMLEADDADIELVDGVAAVKGVPGKTVPLQQIALFGYFGGPARPEDVQRDGLTATSGYNPGETYANGCAAAVVEVDVRTGLVSIEQLAAVEDCGVVLNPIIVKGQVAGALANGIGVALLEDLAYEDNGEFVSGSLMHYLYPSTTEVPDLTLHSIETPSAVSVGGVKGVGEAGTISAPAAIVNAVMDALSPFGIVIEKTPMTPEYIRGLVRAAEAAATGPARS